MPYATPVSPIPSPQKETHKAWISTPTHIEDMEAGPSTVTAPMPGVPRRASSSTSSGHSTPRKLQSPANSRRPSASEPHNPFLAFPASRPMEGLPRRSSSHQGANGNSFGVTGLPSTNGEGGGLGLKLYPSPTKAPAMQRAQESMSSTSTVNSSLPSTPADEPSELPLTSNGKEEQKKEESATSAIPFPSFEPPALRSLPPPHKVFSQQAPLRPSMLNSRRNSSLGHHRGNGPSGGSLQIPIPISASASQLSAQSGPTSSPNASLRPTASMIRKKSGEVVKPSLKIRSMSTPDLSRQKEGSDTSTPDEEGRDFPDERSKSVRFAGGDEGDAQALESVVLFLREQKPLAVGRAADPDHVGFVTDTETEADDTDASDFVQFRTRRNAAARAADEAGQIMLEGGSRVPRIRTDFSPDARGSLQNEFVVLERVELVTGPGPLCLRGTMIVRNVAFQKWVTVRFTLDHWQTLSEVAGTHVSHIPSSTTGDEGWDRFSFTIKLEDFKRKIEDRQLLMCLRYSIGNSEWWDSNDGMNYHFTFKKGPPRRPVRTSGPSSLGGGFLRLNDPASAPLNLRQSRGSPTKELNKVFGASPSNKQTGPKSWVFPKLAHTNDMPPRAESPQPTIPAVAYKVPAVPDVHTHLSLSKYCAPSPPQSPPKEAQASMGPAHLVPEPVKMEMNVMGGQMATLSPPTAPSEHLRRSSWNGNNESWDSFAKAMEQFEDNVPTPQPSTNGESTPVAGAQAPASQRNGNSSESSPERGRPLGFKRSTGDLRALLDAEDHTGLLTPPSSNLSSPPSPSMSALPSTQTPMSPSSSITSTGESSPVDTVSDNDSSVDLANLDIDVNPMDRGRSMNKDFKMLNNGSYQDFLDKFCFFTSPRMTPSDDPVYSRPTYIPISGSASPNGFPFFASNSSNSPRGTPTPTRQYDSAADAFNFTAPANDKAQGPPTPKLSPPHQSSSGYALQQKVWAGAKFEQSAPSLAAQ